ASGIEPEPNTSFGKVAALEASFYLRNQLLRDADWASMAHSLEVRLPFVDAKLVETVAPLVLSQPAATGKNLLAGNLSGSPTDKVKERAKTGFSTPVAEWLQRDDRLQAWRRKPELAVP